MIHQLPNQRVIEGITDEEAQKQLVYDGYNELPSHKDLSVFALFVRVISEPMLLLLLGSGGIYLLLGEAKDALMLLSFVIVVIGITFYQEKKTEKTLAALKNLSSPRALVIRNGMRKRIPGREVVVGDIIELREGDRVPADATVLSCENLSCDESMLTGESVAVRKRADDGTVNERRLGGDDQQFVYSGTMVVRGHGLARVESTGTRTEMGKIGKTLETIKIEDTLLKKETDRIVKIVGILGVSLCFLIFLITFLIRGNLIEGLLSGVTLSMAVLPEEFPVVLVIFMTVGAWRLSKRRVLTRRPAVIETLGAATVLCVDKTGTLTLNKMELTSLYSHGTLRDLGQSDHAPLPEEQHGLLEYAMLSSHKDPFDPLEKEIKVKVEKYLKDTDHIHRNWDFVREYPLTDELLAISEVWHSADKSEYVIAAKGSPEAILDLCHADKQEKAKTLSRVTEMSQKGLRVLGVAKALFCQSDLPMNQHDYNFKLVGLLGFVDPVRPDIAGSLAEAYAAGIHVKMITGDYPGTARYVAREIGLANPDEYLTGKDLQNMDQNTLRKKIRDINIFARVVPEQKHVIVSALKANGEIVAMTGDGVNDAPALKSAHIGISMGERGTDVAREASSIVLLNDDFTSIVAAVRLGRRIYTNLQRAMGYILAVHIPIAGVSFLTVLFNLPAMLLPAHIAFLELIIDPACSVVFESEKEDDQTMKKPPRNLFQPILGKGTVIISVIQGVGILFVVYLIYALTLRTGGIEQKARTFAFATLVFANLLLIMNNLSWKKNLIQILYSKNSALWAVTVLTVCGLILVMYVPFLSALFHFTSLKAGELLLSASFAGVSLLWFSVYKWLRNHPVGKRFHLS